MSSDGIKLLLVDDDESTLFGYERGLASAGYTVTTAQSLKQGKERLAANLFDVILLDFKLPDGNALDLIPEL
jgi:DNA-binding response OmpR family regulator